MTRNTTIAVLIVFLHWLAVHVLLTADVELLEAGLMLFAKCLMLLAIPLALACFFAPRLEGKA